MTETQALICFIIIFVLLIAVFFISYVLNKKTPIPKECLKDIDKEKCSGCHNISCSLRENIETDKQSTNEEEKK